MNSRGPHPPARRSAPKARPASAGPTASAAEAAAKIAPARTVAFEILSLVAANQGHSDELLHSQLTDALSPVDRNLATALVMGTLRWQIALDARIARLLARPDQRLAAPVALALRLGAFQLLHMDRIPPHAVLSQSIELCRAAGEPHATGMVNAVLRKLAATSPPSARIFESTAAFAERLGHPRWLVERWVAHYGREAAFAICNADQIEPAPGDMFLPEIADATSADPLPQMDDGSRLVAELAAAAMPHTAAQPRIWDCCAAPGGKTLILAHRLPAADLLATDVSARRLSAMRTRFPSNTHTRTAVADAASADTLQSEAPFNLILCDVPCSGTGTLAPNPEIRHRLKPEDLARQAARQREILLASSERLVPGGRILYSSCSLEPEENEAVVASLAVQTYLRPVDLGPLLQSLISKGLLSPQAATTLNESAITNGRLRTLPGVHPCGGFFAALFERV